MPDDPTTKFEKLFPMGSCVTFNQGNMQRQVNPDQDARGLCFELTRRWVHRVLQEGDDFDPQAFRDQFYGMSRPQLAALINRHAQRSIAWDYENYEVNGATRTGMVRRRGTGRAPSIFRKVVLKNRDAALEQMWAEPGVYMFAFAGKGIPHMFGFEFKKNHRIRFFDSNDGLYEIPNGTDHTFEKFRQFYKVVWEHKWGGSTSYKQDACGFFTDDKLRVLSRFELNDA